MGERDLPADPLAQRGVEPPKGARHTVLNHNHPPFHGKPTAEVTPSTIILTAANGTRFTLSDGRWYVRGEDPRERGTVSRDNIESRFGCSHGYLDGIEAAFYALCEQRRRDEESASALRDELWKEHRARLDEHYMASRLTRHPLLALWRRDNPTPPEAVPAALAGVGHVKRLDPAALPCHVYFLLLRSEVVYVGQTAGPWPTRIEAHVRDAGKDFDDVWYLEVDRTSLAVVESMHIEKFRPRYNRTVKPEPAP